MQDSTNANYGTPIPNKKFVVRCIIPCKHGFVQNLSYKINPDFRISDARALAKNNGLLQQFNEHLQWEMQYEKVMADIYESDMPTGQRMFLTVDGIRMKVENLEYVLVKTGFQLVRVRLIPTNLHRS